MRTLPTTVVLMAFCAALPATAQPQLNIPSNIHIVPPAATVPAIDAAFVGKWSGQWGGTLASVLIVQQVDPSGKAIGTYFWGTDQYVTVPGSIPFVGQITNGTLRWNGGANIVFQFRMAADGSINGEQYDNGLPRGAVRMTRY
jgi:hypothetical protein